MAYTENYKIETEGRISLSKDDGGPFAREKVQLKSIDNHSSYICFRKEDLHLANLADVGSGKTRARRHENPSSETGCNEDFSALKHRDVITERAFFDNI